MALAASAARLVLAAVFGVAAAAKLADRPGTRRALREFGVAERLVLTAAALLPLVEIAVAAGLLVGASARVAAAAALVLLVAFTLAAGLAMARGRSPDCHCFGQLGSQPVGRGTLVRNALLAALAVVVLATPAATLLAPAPILVAAAVGALALITGARPGRGRRFPTGLGPPREHLLEGLPVSSPAPDLDLTSLSGESVALSSVMDSGRRAVLVRLSPECVPCRSLLADIGRWQGALAHELDVLPISIGDLQQGRALAEQHGVGTMYLAVEDQLADSYRLRPTPSALLIDEHSRVATGPVVGAAAVESLIRLALRPDWPAA